MAPYSKIFFIIIILIAFISTSINLPSYAQAATIDQTPFMPKPGVMIQLSPSYTPAYLKGIVIHPENALKFDFIIYRGDKVLTEAQKRVEYTKLTKYFLASLAIPDDDQWVNLSPYEKDRIIKDDFGKTEMGRDLLAQDYMLKQITSSLIYPENNLGKQFWEKIYTQAREKFGTSNIPVNTFNKVWIIPDDALIYEKGNTAYVIKNHLKVMLEEDYLSLQKHTGISSSNRVIARSQATKQSLDLKEIASSPLVPHNGTHIIASQIVRQIVLPALELEVNEGKNFASLRQVYSGMLLAAWYKRALKESLLSRIYANKAKVKGIDQDPRTNVAIYQQYLKAYKKGVFNFIKDDIDKYTHETIPRKHFSGETAGYSTNPAVFNKQVKLEESLTRAQLIALPNQLGHADLAQVVANEARGIGKSNKAMMTAKTTSTAIMRQVDGNFIVLNLKDVPKAQKLMGFLNKQLEIIGENKKFSLDARKTLVSLNNWSNPNPSKISLNAGQEQLTTEARGIIADLDLEHSLQLKQMLFRSIYYTFDHKPEAVLKMLLQGNLYDPDKKLETFKFKIAPFALIPNDREGNYLVIKSVWRGKGKANSELILLNEDKEMVQWPHTIITTLLSRLMRKI